MIRSFPIKSAALLSSCALLHVSSLAQEVTPPAAEVGGLATEVAPAEGPEPGVARAVPVMERDVMTQLQIFLDQQLFGPGKIDGRGGEFTTKALGRYQRSRGMAETGVLDASIPLESVYPVYTFYTVKPGDLKFVGDVPSQPSAQAKKKYLPYDSILELLTERFHCAPEFLAQINKGVKLERLKPGDTVRVPNVAEFKIEEMPAMGNLPELPEFKERVITVDRAAKMLDLTEGEKLIASVPITPGSSSLPTPAGKWRIVGIAAMPNFRWDKSVLNTGKRSGNFHMLPPGPNNPVGVMWAALNKPGIGIHGTNVPQSIGRAGSHGCMRVANWDAIRLSKMMTTGMTVVIK